MLIGLGNGFRNIDSVFAHINLLMVVQVKVQHFQLF